MKKFSFIICLVFMFNTIVFSQTHFQVVYSGNPYLAMNIYITSATIDDSALEVGDEIGIFDGEYCVGVGVIIGTIDPYLALVASTDEPGTVEIDGFTPGNVLSFKFWDSSESLVIDNVTPTYAPEYPDGTFSSQGTSMVDLAGVTNQAPVTVKPIPDIIIDEDTPEFELARLDTVFYDQDVDDILHYSAVVGNPNIFYNIVKDSIINISFSQDWNGSDTLWITASDIAGDIAIDTIEITASPVNDSPTIVHSILDIILDEDNPDTLIVNLDSVFYDIDEDNLVYSGESDTSDVMIDIDISNNITISLTPNWYGEAQVIFSAYDAEYIIYDTVSIIVNSVNDPPFIVNPGIDVILVEDNPDTVIMNLRSIFDDVDTDSLTFTCSVDDENIIFVMDTLTNVMLSLTKDWNGSAIAIFTASDGEYTSNDTILITVNSVNDNPTIPIILLPENESELLPGGYLVWTFSSDVDFDKSLYYHIQIDDSASFNSPELDESNIGLKEFLKLVPVQLELMYPKNADSAYVITLADLSQFENLTDNTIYYWRVRSLDNNTGVSDWSEGDHFFFFNKINNLPNSVISGFTPADTVVISTLTPTIGWQPAFDPDLSDNASNLAYTFQLSDSLEFDSILVDIETNAGISFVLLDSLKDESVYYYRIQTMDDDGLVSVWSDTQVFITNVKLDPPSDFELLEPTNGSHTLSNEVTFLWSSSYDLDFYDFVNYALILSQDSLFSNYEIIKTGSDTTVKISEMNSGLHYWKVVAYDSDSLITWGSTSDINSWEITIGMSNLPNSEIYPQEFHLFENYPNPFNPVTYIDYQILEKTFVTLAVFDINGRKVTELINHNQSAGFYHLVFNPALYNLANGIYFYTLNAGNYNKVKKMIYLK